MEELNIRKADAVDSDFVFAVKKATFREYVEQVEGGTIHIRGNYTISGLIHRIFALSNFKGTMLDSSPHPALLILSRSISSLSILSIRVEESEHRA